MLWPERWNASPELIRAFIERHSGRPFPHCDAILGLLRDPTDVHVGARELPWGALRGADLFPGPVHELHEQLQGAREQPIRLWLLPHRAGELYLVVELLDDELVAAVMTAELREPVIDGR